MLLNPEFTVAGDTAAEALGWTRVTAAAGIFAAFLDGTGLRAASETFAWSSLVSSYGMLLASFDTRTALARNVEDFEDLWGARNARLLSAKESPFVLQPGQTLTVRVNRGEPVTVTFAAPDFANIADAKAEEVARVLDRALAGADAFMAPGGRGVVIATTAAGVNATLEVTGGTAASLFAFPSGEVSGQDEEGGTFFKRAEYDLMNDGLTGSEFESFERNFRDPSTQNASGIALVPDLRYDPLDRLARFTFAPVDPFIPEAFVRTLEAYTWTSATEAFTDVTFGTLGDLSAAAPTPLPPATPGAAQPISQAPVGGWILGNTSGLTHTDRSGNGYHLSAWGVPATAVPDTLVAGEYALGAAMLYTGVTALSITGPLTITCRVRIKQTNVSHILVQCAGQNETEAENVLYQLSVTSVSSTPQYFAERGAGINIVATADPALNLTLNTWHFLALRRDADGNVTFNVDARAPVEVTGLQPPTGGPALGLFFGGGVAGLQYDDVGHDLKDVMLWNKRLTDAQLAAQRAGMGL